MHLMTDREIAAALKDPLTIAEHVKADDYLGKRSPVQAASLDLSIGEIFVPGTRPTRLGGSANPRRKYTLDQGHTAVIRTREVLHLGADRAGIAFPPSTVSLHGLLMTNPGHIDPGYDGPLHCTVINMGRSPYPLEAGDRIMRVLFFKLDAVPQAPFAVRAGLTPGTPGPTPVTAELLDVLSRDFVDVDKRARAAVRNAGIVSAGISILIPVVVAVVSLFGTYLPGLQSVRDDVHRIDDSVVALQAKTEQQAKFDDRLRRVEETVTALDATLRRSPTKQ